MSERSDSELIHLTQQENKAAFSQLVSRYQARPDLCCSFCGKSNKQVGALIAGPLLNDLRIYICNECVDVATLPISPISPISP